MIDVRAAGPLLELLSRWPSGQPLRNASEVRQICHQPQRAPEAYLHELYPGLGESEIAEMEAVVGQLLPPRLLSFYEITNGARLFEAQVSVSGLVKEFGRDPSKQAPISIEQDSRIFAAVRPEWYRQGFIRIGGVSFERQDELICGPDDRVLVIHADTAQPLRRYSDIFDCLESFTREMGQFWTTEGSFTGEWETIDQLLLGRGGTA